MAVPTKPIYLSNKDPPKYPAHWYWMMIPYRRHVEQAGTARSHRRFFWEHDKQALSAVMFQTKA
jgi:hypothetical protein